MKISLIMATINRVDEVRRFMESLLKQTFRDFELIIVDQNQDGRLDKLISSFSSSMRIQHLKVKGHGLSYARNIGLDHVTGDIVAFSDDDCWYFPNTLEMVREAFMNHPELDGITGRPVDETFKPLLASMPKKDIILDSKSVWHAGISVTIFLKVSAIDLIGKFDEMLGAGSSSPYGSGEETDFLLRILEQGGKIQYCNNLMVGHPNKNKGNNKTPYHTYYSYGCGMGYVLRKHHAPLIQKGMILIRAAGGSLIALASGNIHLAIGRIYSFFGRLAGLIS